MAIPLAALDTHLKALRQMDRVTLQWDPQEVEIILLKRLLSRIHSAFTHQLLKVRRADMCHKYLR